MATEWDELAAKYGKPVEAESQPADPWADLNAKYAPVETPKNQISTPLPIGKDAFQGTLKQVLADTDWGTRNIAGAGTALSNLWEGAKQFVGQGDQQRIESNKTIEKAAPVGAFTGNAALTAIPFGLVGNSLRGATAVGAGIGAMQPVEGEQSLANIAKGKLFNTGLGAVTGAGGQYVANKSGDFISNQMALNALKKSQNSTIDATLQGSVKEGYSIPPSLMPDSGTTSRLLEGLSGKYKTNQLAGIRNQNVTDNLARKALGLPEDAQLTSDAMRTLRTKAYSSGYAPLESLGTIKTDQAFDSALSSVVASRKSAANSFPGLADDTVTPFIDALKQVKNFDSGDAIKMTQVLRDDAGKAFAAGDSALGNAKRTAAKAIEDQIERHLQSQGKQAADALKGFRDARTLMAKAHTVEDAIVEGGGKVNALKLAQRLQAGKPMTGELETIGKFANNFKDVAGVPKSGNANPFTALDFMQGGISGPLSVMAAGPYGAAGALALPAARVAARNTILSPMVQKSMAAPSYSVPFITRMTGGLLDYSPVAATALGVPAFSK